MRLFLAYFNDNAGRQLTRVVALWIWSLACVARDIRGLEVGIGWELLGSLYTLGKVSWGWQECVGI
jgi:hypothetical protein